MVLSVAFLAAGRRLFILVPMVPSEASALASHFFPPLTGLLFKTAVNRGQRFDCFVCYHYDFLADRADETAVEVRYSLKEGRLGGSNRQRRNWARCRIDEVFSYVTQDGAVFGYHFGAGEWDLFFKKPEDFREARSFSRMLRAVEGNGVGPNAVKPAGKG